MDEIHEVSGWHATDESHGPPTETIIRTYQTLKLKELNISNQLYKDTFFNFLGIFWDETVMKNYSRRAKLTENEEEGYHLLDT